MRKYQGILFCGAFFSFCNASASGGRVSGGTVRGGRNRYRGACMSQSGCRRIMRF